MEYPPSFRPDPHPQSSVGMWLGFSESNGLNMTEAAEVVCQEKLRMMLLEEVEIYAR